MATLNITTRVPIVTVALLGLAIMVIMAMVPTVISVKNRGHKEL
jgi:hypothetical protein